MSAADVVEVVAGFSLTNRWLLYTSFMLAPAQFVSGIGNNCPSNLGFLAYNWYTQLSWYWAIKDHELHALSLLPAHFNFLFVVTYLGGVSSGNIVMAILLGLGTGGVIILNTVAAWTSWATNQPEGFGEYQFFFFGWRTLSDGWHKFFLLWQIGDSILAAVCLVAAIGIPIATWAWAKDEEDDEEMEMLVGLGKYALIPAGAALMMLIGWPLVLWTELIVQRNNIQSETDMIAVWLFVAQAGAMLLPSSSGTLGCLSFVFGRAFVEKDDLEG
ncbi:hypothetical protein B0T19DRAFT_432746 [Cercophora scortea]|uniref:Uncharacterized protein n=1 Tax=Cercophora scortea TaxID=314031 RepID=A0AAE0I6X3_9PEZI|nr:hypothetical protein B0T19DRAFT_432746 [Cercophora scortea]